MSRLRVLASIALFGLVGATLAGCAGGGSGTISASAVFSDVSDLTTGAPVQFASLSVGNVKSISLEGGRAKVVMTIEKSANVPANVSAELRQTTILGEHYVDLVSSNSAGAPLANGATITHTQFVPGIQQLVSSGTEMFGAINAGQLAEMIDNGAQAFGHQAPQLRQLLDDFSTVLGGYSTRSAEIQSVIEQLGQFSATLAPDAQQNAEAVSNLAQTTQILSQQSGHFDQLLQSLDDLALQGRSILDTGVTQTEDQLNAFAAVASQLGQNQKALAQLLEYLNGHNVTVASATVNNFVQVLNDVIVCGIPGGGTNGNQPDNTCQAAG